MGERRGLFGAPIDDQAVSEWLGALELPAKRLTAWEVSFVESVTDQFDRGVPLSERQLEILQRIYTEKA
jgi:hypothetical protein